MGRLILSPLLVKKNGIYVVNITGIYGSFNVNIQRYVNFSSEGSDYFSHTNNFQNSLRSPKSNSYLYRYANKLSYACLSKNIEENFYTTFTPAGLERAVIREAARLSEIQQSAIADTQDLAMPLIENQANIDVYDAKSEEIFVFFN